MTLSERVAFGRSNYPKPLPVARNMDYTRVMDLRLRTRPVAEPVREGATVVEVAGELDLHSAPQLRAELARAIESGAPPRVVVDLGGVTFLDSTGVGVLVGALKRAREADGTLHFCNAQARVNRVFEITGLLGALPLFATREAALAAFGPENSASAPSAFQGATLARGESQ